jgi:desulfoferrodoxin-like iron-binding protein
MSEAGARLTCQVCGSSALVLQGGEGILTCCDKPMAPAEPEGSTQSGVP